MGPDPGFLIIITARCALMNFRSTHPALIQPVRLRC